MKLELKHLAPYLPYGLKVKIIDQIRNYKINQIRELKIQLFWDFTRTERNIIKPILRPLSDLTKEIEHNGDKFRPIEYLSKENNVYYHNKYMREIISNRQHLQNQLVYYFKLFEWHFDVFGLIENNLAIDINTL